MHMADALVAPAVAGALYVCSAGAAAYSIKQVRLDADTKKIPVMGVMGAFVFASQMINFTIPGTGSSGHLCGGMLLSALLGPYAGFLTMIGVLLTQCLIFADGGLLALGCNIWNMAFYGCFIGALLIWKPIMRNGMSKAKIIAASVAGCIFTLQFGAFSVVLETTASGITELPFGAFVAAMQPIHLAIGLIEGLITAAVLVFVHEARPQMLFCHSESERTEGKFSFKKTLTVLAVAAVLIGGLLSLAASSYPDGLEWSVEKLTGSADLEAAGGIHQAASSIQDLTSLLPDYGFKGSESALGTTVSGIVGVLIVVGVCIGACYLFKFFKRKKAGKGKKRDE